MTYTFTSESIVQVDGFVYCIGYGKITDWYWDKVHDAIYDNRKGSTPAPASRPLIACNNPSIPVPQLPELVEDISELAKADFDTFQSESNEVTRKMGERYEVCGAYLIGFGRGHKAASKKQFTLEELKDTLQMGFLIGKNSIGVDKSLSGQPVLTFNAPYAESESKKYIASLKPIPSYLKIDISESGEVKIINIKFPE